jgi:hypothetical protein
MRDSNVIVTALPPGQCSTCGGWYEGGHFCPGPDYPGKNTAYLLKRRDPLDRKPTPRPWKVKTPVTKTPIADRFEEAFKKALAKEHDADSDA